MEFASLALAWQVFCQLDGKKKDPVSHHDETLPQNNDKLSQSNEYVIILFSETIIILRIPH